MVEKIIVNPESVRAYGNVVSPKTGADFDEYDCTLEVGEDTVNGETVTVYVLTPETTSISLVLSSSVGSCGIGDSVVLSVTVTEDSEPVSGASVSFKLGGSEIGTGTTNSSGVATYTYTTSSVGSLNFSAVYAGHSSNSVSVVVSHDYSIAFSQSSYPATSGSATLSLTLLDNSSPVSGVTVAVTGSDSSTYSCTTNSSGVGTVTVSNVSSETTFTATYQGVSDTCTVTVQSILWQPALDGTDSISNWSSGTHSQSVSNGVISAKNVKFDDYWSNSGDWELTFEMKAGTNCGIEVVESTQTNADKYCLQILEDGHLFFNYMPTTSRTFQKISTETSTSNYVPIKIKKQNGTYYWYLNGTLIDSVAVNDNWSNVRMTFHSLGGTANCKNIKVESL